MFYTGREILNNNFYSPQTNRQVNSTTVPQLHYLKIILADCQANWDAYMQP